MGTTIGQLLISYDVDKNQTEVKNSLEELGYSSIWFFQPNPVLTYDLPNTTLIHRAKSTDAAIGDLEVVCLKCEATILKAIAVLSAEAVGYPFPKK